MKTESKKIIVGFIILIIAGLAIDTFFFFKIKDNVEGMYAAEALTQAVASSAQQNQTLETLATNLQPEIASLDSRVVASDGAAPFIETVESLARTSGLTVVISSVSDASSASGAGGSAPASATAPAAGISGPYQLLTLDISTTGSWADTHQFLVLLQTVAYKLDLSSISLSQNGEGVESTRGDSAGALGVRSGTPKTSGAVSTWNGQFTVSVLQEM